MSLTRCEAKVLVYRQRILPLSETFIKEQVQSYRRWRAILVGHYPGEIPLDGLDVRFFRAGWHRHISTLARKLGMLPFEMPSALEYIGPNEIQGLKRENAALLHVHFGTDALAAWPLAQALGLPMVVTLHGFDVNVKREWWEEGLGGGSMRQYPAQLLELATHQHVYFVAVSNALRDRAIRLGISGQKVTTRYIGVDCQQFVPGEMAISKRAKRVLFVGRLVEKKGCAYLIRAMADVQESVPDATLIVVGAGPLDSELRNLAKQLGVNATFRGGQATEEVRRELNVARVFCLPSVTAANGDAEGLPISILEAQACGVPVVTSARGGVQEGMEHGGTGFAFAEGDVAALTDRLIATLTDDALAESFARRGPRFVMENFNIRSCTESLEHLYDKLTLANANRGD